MDKESKILVLKSGKTAKRVATDDIIFIHCEDYICVIHFINGKKETYTKPLGYYEKVLPQTDFFRINHNVIIAIKQTDEVITMGHRLHDAVLKDGHRFPISCRRWKAFKKFYYGE